MFTLCLQMCVCFRVVNVRGCYCLFSFVCLSFLLFSCFVVSICVVFDVLNLHEHPKFFLQFGHCAIT